MWTVTKLFMLRLAQDLIQAAAGPLPGPLNNVWMGLYQSPTVPINPDSTLVNITEATYDGYSRQKVVWFPPWVSVGGPEILAAQDLWYSPTDALVANVITGVFLADAFYGGNLLMAAVLPVPGRVLGSPSDAMKVQAQFQLPFLQIYGKPDTLE